MQGRAVVAVLLVWYRRCPAAAAVPEVQHGRARAVIAVLQVQHGRAQAAVAVPLIRRLGSLEPAALLLVYSEDCTALMALLPV